MSIEAARPASLPQNGEKYRLFGRENFFFALIAKSAQALRTIPPQSLVRVSTQAQRALSEEYEMTHPIDLHVGQRLRQRRRLLGLTQQKLADAVFIRFQQIQKYESGANRISASRLWALANALDVPVSFFFEGAEETSSHINGVNGGVNGTANGNGAMHAPADVFQNKDTIDLVRALLPPERRAAPPSPGSRKSNVERALSSLCQGGAGRCLLRTVRWALL